MHMPHRFYLVDYAVLLGLTVLLCVSEVAEPYDRFIYHASDAVSVTPSKPRLLARARACMHPTERQIVQELWRYSYPLRQDTVPAWSVPLISLLSPVLAVLAHALIWRQTPRLEAHNAVLTALSCVMATALATNLVKLGVGRPRPDFAARCWPDGVKQYDAASGLPACAAGATNPAEGRKSFPSGASLHALWHALLQHFKCHPRSRRAHVLEHVGAGVRQLLAGGEAEAVRRQRAPLEGARRARAAGLRGLYRHHPAAGGAKVILFG
jgi:hypothetical protein